MSDADQVALVEDSTRLMVAGFEAIAREDWREAACYFLQAAQMREHLPWGEDAESAWMLAAAWLNHGDMLLRTTEPSLLREALRSFNRTIVAMSHVSLGQSPAHVERLILTWLYRASACGEAGETEQAFASFSHAEALLAEWGGDVTPVRRFMACMLRVNRARLMISSGRPLDAWQEAKEGIRLLRPLDLTVETSRAGIQARSIQCRALAMLLDEPGGPEKVGDWIAEATDSAEEALALVRASGFRDQWVSDLVRYGARIYQACQPQFLGEFLVEWLAGNGPLSGDEILKEEMKGMLWLAVVEAERKVLSALHETEFVEKQTRIVKALQQGLGALG